MAHHAHLTKKQHAQAVAAAAKGRASQKAKRAYNKAHGLPTRTKAQQAASKQNIVKARAAQKARRAGKKYVSSKKPKAITPLGYEDIADYPPELREHLPAAIRDLSVHGLPACGLTAVAAHLEAMVPGIEVTPGEIADLHRQIGIVSMPNLFEALAVTGLAGCFPDTWTFLAADDAGLWSIAELAVPTGWHAALVVPGGLASWGLVIPWPGRPAAAWDLEWRLP